MFSPNKTISFVVKSDYLYIMKYSEIVTVDKDILGGQPVFKGTRVPVESMFDYLENGLTLDYFLEEFSTVSKQQAIQLLVLANNIITSKNIESIYEAVA